MACNTCKNETPDCKCTTSAITINDICNPIVCDADECSESFNAGCIVYNDADIICNGTTIVTAGDTVAQAIANLTAYFCATEGVTGIIVCGGDTVVPADTAFADAFPLVVTYFCDAISALDSGIIDTFLWTSNSGAQPQGTQGTTDTYTFTYLDASTDTLLITNGANGDFTQVTAEAPGVNCTYGGVKIEVIQGLDGVTVLSTDYVCNINPTYNYGLFAQTAVKSLSNSTTPTSMVGAGEGSMDLGANTLAVGDSFAIKASGLIKSNLAATLTLELKAGAVVLGTLTTLVLSVDPAEMWDFEGEFTIRTIGASGNIYTAGRLSHNQTTGEQSEDYRMLSNAVVDTTILNSIDLVATYSLAGTGVTLSTEVLTLIKTY